MTDELLLIQRRIGNNRLGGFECDESSCKPGELEMFFVSIDYPGRHFMIKVYPDNNGFIVKNVGGTTVTRMCSLEDVIYSIVHILEFKLEQYKEEKYLEDNMINIIDKQIQEVNSKYE